jgi:YHS domain-containing protein
MVKVLKKSSGETIMTISRLLLSLSPIGLAIVIAGCNHQAAKEQNQTSPLASPAGEQSAVGGDSKQASADQSAPDVSSGLAELSVEDRELAKKQRVCPVSGELLGAMGKPFKTTVKGKTVFLCCQGCEHDLNQNPDKYLAKLKNAAENNSPQEK